MNKLYENMTVYDRTEVLKLRLVIVCLPVQLAYAKNSWQSLEWNENYQIEQYLIKIDIWTRFRPKFGPMS